MIERVIYFLKELPDKYLLVLVLIIMLSVAIRFGAIEPREIWLLVRDITIAIISIAGYKRLQAAQEINADIKTDTVSLTPPEPKNTDSNSPTPSEEPDEIDTPVFHEVKKEE